MTRDELLALADRAERATGPDRELDALVHCAREGLKFVCIGKDEAYGAICDPGDAGYGSSNRVTPGLLYARYPDSKRGILGGGKLGNRVQGCAPPAYTASLDAALTLVPEGWPVFELKRHPKWLGTQGDEWGVYLASGTSYDADEDVIVTGSAATPALALVAAALRTRLSAAIPANDAWPSDGTCRECGSAPRDQEGLCATCADDLSALSTPAASVPPGMALVP